MKALAVLELLRKAGTWVDWSDTPDGLKLGDPAAEVTGIAVGWKPYWSDLTRAQELGCNFFLTHESLFREDLACERERPKLDWLRESGMVVYRCHDVWDLMPGIGIRDSWARGLGFEREPLAESGYYRVEDVSGYTFGSLCRQLARRVAPLGQQGVLAVGDDDRSLTRLGLGTGAAIRLELMLELGVDVCVLADDYFRFVRDGALLRDIGIPFIIVNHATAEEWGMRNLFEYIRNHFPAVPTHFLPQGCLYRITSSASRMDDGCGG